MIFHETTQNKYLDLQPQTAWGGGKLLTFNKLQLSKINYKHIQKIKHLLNMLFFMHKTER